MEDQKTGGMKGIRIAMALAAVAVIAVGVYFVFPKPSAALSTGADRDGVQIATVNGDIQEVAIDLEPSAYKPIAVQTGVPVRLNIRVKEENLNSCNNAVLFSEYKVKVDLKPGDNWVEFTPDKAGTYAYTCWMGMITSYVAVVDDLQAFDASKIDAPAGQGAACACCGAQ